MTHDLTHCKGIGCPKKHGCLRYLAHLDADTTGIPYLPYTTEMIDHGYCPMYVRSEEYKGISQYNNKSTFTSKTRKSSAKGSKRANRQVINFRKEADTKVSLPDGEIITVTEYKVEW